LFSVVFCAPMLNAQAAGDGDIQKQLDANLKNKVVILRHFYSGNRLKYNSEGALVSGGKPGLWTLNAYFEPKKIKLSKESITISGKRIRWTYDDSKSAPKVYSAPDDTKIEIRRSPEQNDPSKVMASILKVFLKSDEPLEDFVPSYWKKIIQSGFDAERIKRDEWVEERTWRPAIYEQLNVSLPQIKYQLAPDFTEDARKIRLQGTVWLSASIDENGVVKVTDILKPLGAGLDDNAVKTIEETWRFSPAMRDGAPIPFDFVLIEVMFKLI